MKIVNSSLSIPVPLKIVGPNKEQDTIIIAPRGTVTLPEGYKECPRDFALHKTLLRKKAAFNAVPQPEPEAPAVEADGPDTDVES